MASFKRLSPSRTVTILLGTRRPLIIEMAATASGGEIIAPSTRPKIQPLPGIMRSNRKATAMLVMITRPVES